MFPAALRAGTIGVLRLRNRLIMGSMHLGIEADVAALAEFYAQRARNDVALIVTGGSCVNRAGAGGRNYSFINEDASAHPLSRAVEAVHREGGLIALQLFHAGRYAYRASFGLQPLAPSAIASRFSPDPPRAMDEADIEETIADFASGAQRARSLGFDAVEVMASEGYLLNQFLSPLTNRRDDAWGGDLERRMRMPVNVLRAIRGAAGDEFPVIFRISGADLMQGSSTPDEASAFARRLAEEGVNALNVGIGWHESPVPTVQQMVPHGVWVRFAAAIKTAVGDVPVIASNRINSIALADAVIASGGVDFVSMARPFLADAEIVSKSARGEAALVNTCIACNQACIDRSLIDAPVSCMVNPRAGRELDFPEWRTGTPRRFAVIGGGPAGMECARALAALGHCVELFEAENELGGQFRMARRIPGKAEFGETIRYYANELPRLGVDVHLNEPISDPQTLHDFDGVVLATGVLPKKIAVRGRDLPHVIDYAQLLARDAPTGEHVAILGAGGIGVDVAHFLSHGEADVDATTRFLYEQGLAAPDDGAILVTKRKTVAVMRRGRSIGERLGKTTRWTVLAALRAAGVSTLTGVDYEAIEPGGIRVRTAAGEEQVVRADTVVVAAGQERNDALLDGIRSLGVPFRVIGGARDAGELDAVRAFEEGLRAAHALSSG